MARSSLKHFTSPSPPAESTPLWIGRILETPTEAKAPPPRGVRNFCCA